MDKLFTFLQHRRFIYEPLIQVLISRERLIHNLHEFMKLAPQGNVAPVLKSNAYGHGLIEVARILEHEYWQQRQIRHRSDPIEKHTIPFAIVDSYFEAAQLRAAKIRMPLLVIGYTRPEIIGRSRLKDVSFAVTSLDNLRHIADFQSSILISPNRQISIHLKIDTGMRRQGILPEQLNDVAHLLDINPGILLRGICSHLSDADNPDPSFTESQLHIWNKIVEQMQTDYASIKYVHISNTDGHRFVRESRANLSRVGIGLYGLTDGTVFSPPLGLKPVLSMHSIITGIKKLMRDETVGYGNTYKAEKDMTIATVPAGYYEGVDRRLSNQGIILVGTDRIPCPIIGRVCMNMTMIDISEVPDAAINMPVTIISNEPKHENSMMNIAQQCSTIPHEIAVHVEGHLRRIVID